MHMVIRSTKDVADDFIASIIMHYGSIQEPKYNFSYEVYSHLTLASNNGHKQGSVMQCVGTNFICSSFSAH